MIDTNAKIFLGVGVLLLFALSSKANAATPPPQPKKFKVLRGTQSIRSDSEGDGNFGASRGGRQHNGIDILVNEFDEILAPFEGTVTRHNIPYANDTKWKGIEITATDGIFKVKIFYCVPNNRGRVGERVTAGQVIAKAQNISKKYSSKMKNHIHIELYENGNLVNPTNYFI